MTVNYLRRGLAIMFLCASTLVLANCGKDDETTNAINNSTDNPSTPQPQQKTEEFIYDANLYFYRPGSSNEISRNAFIDTVAKLGDDQSVKQIHITPETSHMFENLPSMDARANILDNMYGQSNGKLSGENTTLYLAEEALQSTSVQSVLHNKLKIELLQSSK